MTTFLLHTLAFLLVFCLLGLLYRRRVAASFRRKLELRDEVHETIIKSYRESIVFRQRLLDDALSEVSRLNENLRATVKTYNDLVGRHARLKMENAHLVFCHKTACDRVGIAQRVVERLHKDVDSLKQKLATMMEFYQNVRNVLDERIGEVSDLKAENSRLNDRANEMAGRCLEYRSIASSATSRCQGLHVENNALKAELLAKTRKKSQRKTAA